MSDEEGKKENDKVDYKIDPSRPFLSSVRIQVDPEAYNKVLQEKEELEAQLTDIALRKFDEEKQKLLNIASSTDKEVIQNIETPEQLEHWKGRYYEKMHAKYTPESSGQAFARDYSRDQYGLQREFENPKEMATYLMKISMEIDPHGKSTPRSLEAKRMLRELSKKMTIEGLPRKMVLEDDDTLRMKGLNVVGKGEKGHKSQYTRVLSGEGE